MNSKKPFSKTIYLKVFIIVGCNRNAADLEFLHNFRQTVIMVVFVPYQFPTISQDFKNILGW